MDGQVIVLTRGLATVIDSADWEREFSYSWLNGSTACVRPCDYMWRTHPANGGLYVVASSKHRNGTKNGLIMLHRVVTSAPRDRLVDHIDGNTLDNRRANLRLCTYGQNAVNRGPNARRAIKGVRERCGRWQACITVDRSTIVLGTFATQKEACDSYDKAAVEHFGEFAFTNGLHSK